MTAQKKHESEASRALLAWCRANTSMLRLSREFGLSESMVSSIAHGYSRPSADIAIKIEQRCGISACSWPRGLDAPKSAEDCALDVGLSDVIAFAGEDVRHIPFAPGFFVTESGRLIRASKRRGIRFVRTWAGKRTNGKPYQTAVLRLFGQPQVAVRMSRLVCLVFNGPPPDDERQWVLHHDDNPANDHYTNLRWGTAKENTEDALRNESLPRGFTNARAKRAIEMASQGRPVSHIARHFGVTRLTVENLLAGRTWLHIEGVRRINTYVSRQRVAIELCRLGFCARDISILVDIKLKSIHEMLSRARRLGQLPRLTPPAVNSAA